MQHYLITRFNLINHTWEKDLEMPTAISESWLSERFKIFERFCLPSVINQKNKKFVWLVLFDSRTPILYKDKIKQYKETCPNFKELYINGFDSMLPEIKNFIKLESDNNCDYIITTRLDSDDLIHENFISVIQNSYNPRNNVIIDLKHGYQLILNKNNNKIRRYSNNFNPFISLIESIDNFNTVVSKNHHYFRNFDKITPIDKMPLWIQLIHGKNKSNHELSHLPIDRKIDLKKFGIANLKINDNKQKVFVSNLISVPFRIYHLLKNYLKQNLK